MNFLFCVPKEENEIEEDDERRRIIFEDPDEYKKLAKGQHPKFLVFACSDSRVCPSHVLNFKPGQAFMVRNIANMAKVKSEWGDKSFEQHCQYCEKESVDSSLVNLLSDPYARAAVAERDLKLVGGYYNFVHGTFGFGRLMLILILCV
ncbi:Carbonic anhydrase, chloroplastic [Vitis vinifera]|uniref:Carbonic anhydrase n=1 Tax=Vitis vinifera TaxID=29760 RepID=A0A438EZF4_VITVI|nr:Carbonic anhydrase, chloroplastic [Vitis vinifera]